MVYNLGINRDRIKRIVNPVRLTKKQVMRAVQIEPEHLSEKNNWFVVANVLSYFKARKDCRLLGELLNKEIYGRFNRPTADYQLIRFDLGPKADIVKIGLLSPNIQRPDYEYYDVSNLHQLYPEMTRKYGHYTIKKLLEVLETNQVPGYQALINEIITTYVLDWFCHQLDRNPKNLLFERSVDGNLALSPLIDNESSFGINGNGKLDTNYSKLWIPAIPYSEADFASNPSDFDGCDYNIVSLLMDYPEQVLPVLEQLTDENFDEIINQYKNTMNSKIYLSEEGLGFLRNFVYDKQKESDKILHL